MQGSFELIDEVGLGFGISLDLFHVSLVDGKVRVQRRFTQGASFNVWFFEAISPEVEYYHITNNAIQDTSTVRDATTFLGGEAYFIAGGSFSIGFDVISFFADLDRICWDQ